MGAGSYPSAEKQSVYSMAPANWADHIWDGITESKLSIVQTNVFYTVTEKRQLEHLFVNNYIPLCLTLSIIRYVSRVKWSRERSSTSHLVVAIENGAFWLPSTMVATFTYLLNTQHYKDKWSNQGKGVAPCPTPWCSSF